MLDIKTTADASPVAFQRRSRLPLTSWMQTISSAATSTTSSRPLLRAAKFPERSNWLRSLKLRDVAPAADNGIAHPDRPYGKLRGNIRTLRARAKAAHRVRYKVTTGDTFGAIFWNGASGGSRPGHGCARGSIRKHPVWPTS